MVTLTVPVLSVTTVFALSSPLEGRKSMVAPWTGFPSWSFREATNGELQLEVSAQAVKFRRRGSTVSLKVSEAELGVGTDWSVTVTVKAVSGNSSVGVPLISPVVEEKVNPAGKMPPESEKVGVPKA